MILIKILIRFYWAKSLAAVAKLIHQNDQIFLSLQTQKHKPNPVLISTFFFPSACKQGSFLHATKCSGL